MSRQTKPTITIGRTKLRDFDNLTLHQSTSGHHRLILQVDQHWWAEAGSTLFGQVKDLIGERLFLQITPKRIGHAK